VLATLDWINIGGGYLFAESDGLAAFVETVHILRSKYNLDVFVEPGAAFVRSSGSLRARVVDMFQSDDKVLAILDTTINHLPEVFEYQYEPDVREHVDGGRFEYTLAGCSCLAGDVFGDYCFNDPLELGSRITFENVGAYSLVKAHMFNGINLPSIYMMDEDGSLELVKEFTFEDFANHCGFPSHKYANH
jgi:carboxynorspermidine decarboxylase